MAVSLEQWKRLFAVTADLLSEHADELSKIDAVIGDGDHGVTIAKIADLMREKTVGIHTSAAEFFGDLGWAVINVQGGSAGPLFGTMFSGMQNAPENADAVSTMECALQELQTISKARAGEKTMMDALIPAVEAMKAAADDGEAFELAAAAAAKGADDTAGYIARYGRAKNYGEKSLGIKDAGACSIALIFEGFAKGYKESGWRTEK